VESRFADPYVQDWFQSRTFGAQARHVPTDPASVAEQRRATGLSVAVCLPALDEAATIGDICRAVSGLIAAGVADELLVLDSGSEDATAEIAQANGARVHHMPSFLPERTASGGKGASLWKSLALTEADIVVWVDSDIRNFQTNFITSLIAPLFLGEGIRYVKAFYERPLAERDELLHTGGARVTEILVRPLLQMFYPELVGMIQPLSGEYAGFRTDLSSLPFFTGYGVEIGLLLDVHDRFGLDAIAQSDLGRRVHRNRDVLSLGRMASQVAQAMFRRLEQFGRIKLSDDLPGFLTQFVAENGATHALTSEVAIEELPPMEKVRPKT
jgi:glucosyl-3-phosphoglycerate synthase